MEHPLIEVAKALDNIEANRIKQLEASKPRDTKYDELNELITRKMYHSHEVDNMEQLEEHIQAVANKLNVDVCVRCGEIMPCSEDSHTLYDDEDNAYCEDCWIEIQGSDL